MNLFVFGLGYTARYFISAYKGQFSRISGTSRMIENTGVVENSDIQVFRLDSSGQDPRILDELSTADALLVSIPPVGGADPVLEQFADAIASAPRLRWVGYLSTVGVYGDAQGGWVDEDTAPCPVTTQSQHRLDVERRWVRLGQDAGLNVHAFRLAGIYGPKRNALRNVANGTAQRIVKPGQVFNRIHVGDIAQLLMCSIEHPTGSTIYNVTDDEPAPPQDVVAYAAELLGRAPPPEVPFEKADMSPMARSFYQDNKRVRNTRIKTELGVTLLYPTYREGLKALFDAGEGGTP